MGITEPAVFGVFVKYRRPFLAVIIGGGLGGLIAGLTGVKTMGFVWGLAALPTYLAGGTSNFIWMLVSVIVGFAGAAVVAYGVGIPDEETEEELEEKDLVAALESNQGLKQVCIGKIAEGTVVPLSEISDKAFASGALGKGVGILPSEAEETIISPVEGTVTVAFPTKHAYGIKTKNGVELLIHIGVDTVNLEGKYFEGFVDQGQEIKKGDILAKYQADQVEEAGFDPVIIVVVTNSNDYLDVISTSNEQNEELLTVIL
jgi:PTS system beta-glucosides-specific IIC component